MKTLVSRGIGADRVIDAVGADANRPQAQRGNGKRRQEQQEFERELKQAAPQTHPQDGARHPGDAPSQALIWAVEAVDKGGTNSVVGVYPPTVQLFPFGRAVGKNLTIRAGACNHRKYIPMLLELVQAGAVNLTKFVTQRQPLSGALDAYKAFDQREPGRIKVELLPAGAGSRR